ncbi:DUF2975 domain-containing protein [Pedobacter aquatilis]|uniref:DUF2975 domain-containing protein n=1 Tax=Pedobacter aquatilis TaxID=351343 RepID=UPI0025B529A0|nr:DUF2975 domain-containing protein [Pedobacter aquatilis]MDN3588917.1 DUF2975 domain-containing protein [Pedobacter aquatilis]
MIKTYNQLVLVKVGYIVILTVIILLGLEDGIRGFNDGWNGVPSLSIHSEDAKPPVWYFEFLFGSILFVMAYLGVMIIAYLYAFVNSANSKDVFIEKNYVRLYKIGVYAVVTSFLVYTFNVLKITKSINFNMEILRNAEFNVWLLIFGITMLAVAFVFKKGIALQEQNDLTI